MHSDYEGEKKWNKDQNNILTRITFLHLGHLRHAPKQMKISHQYFLRTKRNLRKQKKIQREHKSNKKPQK